MTDLKILPSDAKFVGASIISWDKEKDGGLGNKLISSEYFHKVTAPFHSNQLQ
jgi:hypothetical protein